MRVAVVMAGGTGERFWPVSRPDRPKQLLNLTSPDMTMIEEAVDRIAPGVSLERVYIATSRSLHGPMTDANVVAPENVLSEPARRNTLGAICWVVASLRAAGHEDATVAILTADHMIGEPDLFRDTVLAAMEAAEEHEALVTLGVEPTRAETGYGYIEVDRETEHPTSRGHSAHRASRFREKPRPEVAEEFVRSGNFLWNSGMFFFTIPTFLRELARAHPLAHASVDRVTAALVAGDDTAAAVAFEELPNLPVDIAVMEQAERVFVLPAKFPWDDVGAWDALGRSFPLDEEGNARQGKALLIDTSECVVYNDDPSAVIATLGVSGLIIVNTPNAVLVIDKSRAQEVKQIVERLSGK